MKSKIKLFGIVVLVAMIGFSMAACDSSSANGMTGTGGVDQWQPVLTGTVSIYGNPSEGYTLTANASLSGSGTIRYQWQRWSGTGWVPIPNATARTFTVRAADVGFNLLVTVSRDGNLGVVHSAYTYPVVPSLLPVLTGWGSIGGTAQVDQVLSANIVNLGGSGAISFNWWVGEVIHGSFNTFTPRPEHVGQIVTLLVTRSGNSGYVISDSIGPITAAASIGTPMVTSVTVSPSSASVARGGTHNFFASVAGTNNPLQGVIWSIDQTNRHAQTVINTAGVLTVAAAESLTVLTVRATSLHNPAISGTASVTLTGGGVGSQITVIVTGIPGMPTDGTFFFYRHVTALLRNAGSTARIARSREQGIQPTAQIPATGEFLMFQYPATIQPFGTPGLYFVDLFFEWSHEGRMYRTALTNINAGVNTIPFSAFRVIPSREW